MPTGRDGAGASVEGLDDDDLRTGEMGSALRQVVQNARGIIGADVAGLLLVDDQDALLYLGADGGDAASVDAAFTAAQEGTTDGPCVDALIYDRVVATVDLEAEGRWPRLQGAAAGSGVRALLAVPVHFAGAPIGALNLGRREPGPWAEDTMAAALAHAGTVEEVLGAAVLARQQDVLVEQLTRALESRVTIERAVGVLMARHHLDATRAFDELRQTARRGRRRVQEVAEELLAHPDFAPPARSAS